MCGIASVRTGPVRCRLAGFATPRSTIALAGNGHSWAEDVPGRFEGA